MTRPQSQPLEEKMKIAHAVKMRNNSSIENERAL